MLLLAYVEISLSTLVASLACTFVLGCVWKAVDWLWLKPKRLERRLTKHGFRGHSYRLLFGDKKEMSQMVKQTTSKPMGYFSNDYFPRIFPFHQHTIKNFGRNSFVWDGPTPTVIITKPEIMREMLMKVYDFQKPIQHPLLKKLTNGLVRLEGQKWAQDRKLITPAFHMEKLKHMLPAFYASCHDMIIGFEKMTAKTGSHEVEMWSILHNMSADAISRAAFGSNLGEGRRVFELLREHVALTVGALQTVYVPGWRFLPTNMNRTAAKINTELEALLKDMISKRQKAMEAGEAAKDDLLGILLKSSLERIQTKQHGKNRKQDIKLSLKQVIEECKLFYIAGQDTTSSLLVWTLILLSKHKDWQEQAREEILNAFGHNTPDFDGLTELKKVNMILHEVLRMYPPVTVLSRKVTHDTRIGDMTLPAGVLIHFPVVYVQHNEELWGSTAKEFNPGRFSHGILKATGGNMSFFSFAWGPRICIGSNFAMMEAKMTLAMILQRFYLDLAPSYAHAPSVASGTLRPQLGANLILHRM